MDDHALVRKMLAGDEAAFGEFFDTYFPRLFRFACRRLAEDAAEDVVQATLMKAMRKLGTWRGEAALFTWLCTLCRHEVTAFTQRARRGPDLRPMDDDPELRAQLESLAADIDGPERRLERHELAALVQLTLDFLPHRYGDLLEWKYLDGLTVAEIAGRVESSPKAVESMLTRARQAFREGFATLAHSQS
jgi:RNA polymerase sigma-70 factor, ECF subfamily